MSKKNGKRISIVIEAAVVIALVGGFVYINNTQVAPTTVYKYARDLNQSTVITSSDIESVSIPKDAVTDTMVTNPNDIVDKALDNSVHKGDYVTSGALVEKEDVDKFANMDLSNYRQIAIDVSRQTMIGGNLASGDTVDLAFVSSASEKDGDENLSFTYTKTFMENVLVYKVLQADGTEYVNNVQTPQYDEDGNLISSTPAIVILAVTADQAEEILTRQQTGSIRLVGRFASSEDIETSGFVSGDYGKVNYYYANPEE